MKSTALAVFFLVLFPCSGFTCGKKKEEANQTGQKEKPAAVSPLSDEFKPSIQIKEQFEIHAGGCEDNPDLASDFNYYTAENQKLVEKYGLTVQVIKDSGRCGYTLHKGKEKLDMEWTDLDSFWKQFKAFYNLTD